MLKTFELMYKDRNEKQAKMAITLEPKGKRNGETA